MDRNDAVQIIVVIMHVALRKESVDRNYLALIRYLINTVALRKESVDRNIILTKQFNRTPRRSPQGERG